MDLFLLCRGNGGYYLKAIKVAGQYALVDSQDYPKLRYLRWALNRGYACCRGFLMHNYITPPEEGKRVEHIDGDAISPRCLKKFMDKYGCSEDVIRHPNSGQPV